MRSPLGRSPGHRRLQVTPGDVQAYCSTIINLRIGSMFTVAETHDRPVGLVMIRRFSGPDLDLKLDKLLNLHHESLLDTIQVFSSGSEYLVVSPFLEFSLEEVIGGPAEPTEPQVAHMIRQILRGVEYLHHHGWNHGQLGASSVLQSRKGRLKIGVENCTPRSVPDSNDLAAVKDIMLRLMGVCDEDGALHTEWSEFTTSFLEFLPNARAEDALKHQFIARQPPEVSLLKVFIPTAVAAYRFWSMEGTNTKI